MQYKNFTSTFSKQVFELEIGKQIDLAIVICKKLYFEYQLFTKVHKWGDSDILIDCILLIERSKNEEIDSVTVLKAIDNLATITPDMDDFGDNIGFYALNTCVAVHETLQFLLEPLPKFIYNVGIALTDTVDFKIQEDVELTNVEIDKHPLMVEARNFLIQETKQ